MSTVGHMISPQRDRQGEHPSFGLFVSLGDRVGFSSGVPKIPLSRPPWNGRKRLGAWAVWAWRSPLGAWQLTSIKGPFV